MYGQLLQNTMNKEYLIYDKFLCNNLTFLKKAFI